MNSIVSNSTIMVIRSGISKTDFETNIACRESDTIDILSYTDDCPILTYFLDTVDL